MALHQSCWVDMLPGPAIHSIMGHSKPHAIGSELLQWIHRWIPLTWFLTIWQHANSDFSIGNTIA